MKLLLKLKFDSQKEELREGKENENSLLRETRDHEKKETEREVKSKEVRKIMKEAHRMQNIQENR
jgi:hypothetical protein